MAAARISMCRRMAREGDEIMDEPTPDLDRLMARLKGQPSDRTLQSLEPHVWQRIAARSTRGGIAGQLQWRVAAVGLSLSLGAAFGGAAAAGPGTPPEMAVFSVHAMLAPSTILEGGR